MYVSTTSDSSSVGSVVSSPHFSRLLSNLDLFFRLHPSTEYFSLSVPAHQKMIMVVKKDCLKKLLKEEEKSRERRFIERWMDKWMAEQQRA